MKIKRFFAKDMRTALAEVKEVLGSDAVIMSNKKVTGGVEIVAAIDNEPPAKQDVMAEQVRQHVSNKMDKAQHNRRFSPEKIPTHRTKQTKGSVNTDSNENSMFSSVLTRLQENQSTQADNEPDTLEGLLKRQHRAKHRAAFEFDSDVSASQESKEKYTSSSRSSSSLHGLHRNPYSSDAQYEKSRKIEALYRQKQAEKKQTPSTSPVSASRRHLGRESSASMEEMQSLRQEMVTIRHLLEYQLSGLMWQEIERKEPLRAMLIKRLTTMGLSPHLADQFASYIPESVPAETAWQELLNLLADQVITSSQANNDVFEHGGVVALLGPTGVGKTTTVAKLAARAAMDFGAEEIALVTTDTYRIGAHEQLATYGKILGCPVKVANDADELAEILYHLRHRRLVLMDTAGMGQRDMRLSEQLDALMLESGTHIHRLLVLAATSQRRVLEETLEYFRRVPLLGCVLTKLDESLSLGEVLSVVIENALPVTFLTDGQRVPEDIRQAEGRFLVEKAHALLLQQQKQDTHIWHHDLSEPKAADFYD